MAYKLVALDLDDTLLDKQKRISPKDREAVLAAREKGVRIVLSSGRAYQGILPFKDELGLSDYIIACGGAQVADPEGKIIFSKYLPSLVTKQAMRWAAVRNIYFQLYMDEGFCYPKRTECTDYYERRCAYSGLEMPDLMERDPVLAAKVLFVDSNENIERYRRELELMFPEFLIKKSQDYFLEILNPDATKGSALEFLAKKLELQQNELLAIGDSEIDESMIEYAGMGIAVENADPACKAAANDITASCDSSGVALSLRKYILEVSP